ncbi:hypothetical protein [Microbacterium sp. zg-YB36]|uniref:hypothetical protein n=1 Tax=Microbacterium sp. zg-YB36 TaxID=2969407 RepID=UPI00214AA70B|nr:hypothetical protein [Microbacterium sp. zg-YB36]MDL5351557.1 hypothetical protein [Microbacterium sp. zg-YB36]
MLVIGLVIAVLAALAVGVNLFFFSRVKEISEWQTDVIVPGGFFGLSPSAIEEATFFVAVPGGLALLAFCFIGTGWIMRGKVGTREREGLQGGTVVSITPILAPRLHLLWLGVAVAFWVALVIVPIVSAMGGGWPITVDDMPQGYVWATLGMYGGLSAAIAGVLLASFLKKRRYLAMVAAEDPRLLEQPSGFWRWFTFRWRFDLWLAGVGGLLVGISPLPLTMGEALPFVLMLVGGILLIGVGAWCASHYWRAGVPLGVAESYA